MIKRLSICRYDLPQIIADKSYRIAAEVGVEHGMFSYYLLRHSGVQVLYSIDPYQGKFAGFLEDAKTLLSEFGERSRLVLRTSAEAAKDFVQAQRTVDLVYLDGDHRYRKVAEDIRVWWPLVKPGGLLCGHDYCSAGVGVMRAVDEFAAMTNRQVYITREAWATWMIYKPS